MWGKEESRMTPRAFPSTDLVQRYEMRKQAHETCSSSAPPFEGQASWPTRPQPKFPNPQLTSNPNYRLNHGKKWKVSSIYTPYKLTSPLHNCFCREHLQGGLVILGAGLLGAGFGKHRSLSRLRTIKWIDRWWLHSRWASLYNFLG